MSQVATRALSVLGVVSVAYAAKALSFYPPSPEGPLVQTANYTGFSNSTLNDTNVVPGIAFDRYITIWLENTDFATANSTETFRKLADEAVLFTRFHGVTHPSEPNYVAALGGDFFGMDDDDYYHIPSNISCVVDLLEEKSISWATYQENMPEVAFYGDSYTQPNYLDESGDSDYAFYMRKHNPVGIFDSASQNETRANRIRNFNDFANDVVNGTLPQWVWITPNMVDDAHDTTIDFAADFLEYFLVPLLEDKRVNDDRTLIVLTFDENETYDIQNNIFTLALGGAVPAELKGTTDPTFYTHYSEASTVEANWELSSLGRQDTNKTMSNVFKFVAEQTGYENVEVSVEDEPLLNLTGIYPGALHSKMYQPFAAPNLTAVGAGGGPVYIAEGLNTSATVDTLPPVSETELSPWIVQED